MDWIQFAIFMISNIIFSLTLWLWNRAESRSDMRITDMKLEAHKNETNLLLKAIHDEMKDFHGRLCAIEERNKK